MSTLHDFVSYFRPNSRAEDRKTLGRDEADKSSSSNANCGLSWNGLHSQLRALNNDKDQKESPTEVHKTNELLEMFEPPKIQRLGLQMESLRKEEDNDDVLCFDASDDDLGSRKHRFFPKPVLSTSLNELNYPDSDEENHTGVYPDDSTVIVSNRLLTGETNVEKCTYIQNHCSLQQVYHINLSAPLKLPQRNKSGKLNTLIRRRFSRGRYSKNDSTRSMNVISASRTSNRFSVPRLLSKKGSIRSPILQGHQQALLIGTTLNSCHTQRSFLVKKFLEIRNDFHVGCQISSPRDEFEILLKDDNVFTSKHSCTFTKRLKRIFKRHPSSQERFFAQHKSWSELDDAVKGRLDGIDVLYLGSAKRVIRRKSDKRHLDFGKIVQESLWISCGRKPSVVIFEGLTGVGKGSDRWSATINKVENFSNEKNQNLLLNPDCSICANGQQLENISISVNSIEEIQQSYDKAVEPLIFGDIKRSIAIMNKISVSLQRLFKDPDKAHHTIGSTHHNIASLHLLDGNFDQALVHINKAISTRIRSIGFDHESVAVSLAKLGLIYIGLDRLSDALDAFQQALKMRTLDDKLYQLDVAKLFNNIGVVCYLQGHKKMATRHFIEAVRIQYHYTNSSLCRDFIKYDIAISLSNMAKTYLKREMHQMSVFLYEEVLEHQLSILDKDHVDVLETLDNIAFVKLDDGDKTNAMTIYKNLHKLQVAKFGCDSYQAVGTLCMMSYIMIQISNYTVALRYLNEVLQRQLQILDQNDTRIKNTQSIIASLQSIIQKDLHEM